VYAKKPQTEQALSTVSEHERTRNGRTEHVRRHDRTDPGMSEKDQNKRDAFERRVLRERQAARRGQELPGGRPAGQRKPKSKVSPRRASRHAMRALDHARRGRLFRFLLYSGLTVGTLAAWGIASTAKAAGKRFKHFWNEVPA
jgi:hypothetical protein